MTNVNGKSDMIPTESETANQQFLSVRCMGGLILDPIRDWWFS